jgi:large subunit ribosomal protein L23
MSIFSKKTTDDSQADAVKAEGAEVKAVKKTETSKESKTVSMKDLYAGEAGSESVKDGAVNHKKGGKFELAYKILVKPLVTEKATNLSTHNKYAFEVSRQSNKISVGKAIEQIYKIKPLSVNIIQCQGKKVSYGKSRGQKKNWKKAIVTLPKEKTINIYEGV